MLTSLPPPAWMIRVRLLAVQRGGDLVACQHDLLQLDLGDPRRHGDPVAQLAVDLDRDLVGRLDDQGLVDRRPRLGVDRRPGLAPRLGQPRPQLLGDVRRRRRQHEQEQPDRLVPLGQAGDGRAAVARQQVRELHELRDHRVPAEALEVLGHVAQRPVRRRAHPRSRVLLGLTGRQLGPARSPASVPCGSITNAPHAVQELVHAADAGRAPRAALVPGAHEHQEQPDRVGAVARDQLVRVLDVAPALAHPLAVGAQDLALVEQPPERLALLDQADVAHRLGPEPAVQQVHDRVLRAARVLLDGRPGLDQVRIDRRRRPCAATGSGTSTTTSR